MDNYQIIRPSKIIHPIILSVPHCGHHIPEELADQYVAELLPPDDTDWFVDQLYDFASEAGIIMIRANISRWVIDLNRSPDNAPLYHDGRVITDLCPCTNFLGTPIYNDARSSMEKQEVERRKRVYFDPYYQAINELIEELHARFQDILLWDCHSIRRYVPSIRSTAFPDMIIGDADGQASMPELSKKAVDILKNAGYDVNYNDPFKGGNITRFFGFPDIGVNAIQLEMAKDLYMDSSENKYAADRATGLRHLLKEVLTTLSTDLLNSHQNNESL